jgi:hypothetical protein
MRSLFALLIARSLKGWSVLTTQQLGDLRTTGRCENGEEAIHNGLGLSYRPTGNGTITHQIASHLLSDVR